MFFQILSLGVFATRALAWNSCGLHGFNELGLYPDEVSGDPHRNTFVYTSGAFTLNIVPSNANISANSSTSVVSIYNSTAVASPFAYPTSNLSAASWVFLTFVPDARYSSILFPSGVNAQRDVGNNDMALFLRNTITKDNPIEPLRYADSTLGDPATYGTFGTLGFYVDGYYDGDKEAETVGAPLKFLGWNGIPASFVTCTNKVIDGADQPGPYLYYKWANTTAPLGCTDVQLLVYETAPCT